MKWEPHYTGIEIYNPHGDGSGLYMHRSTRTKRIEFFRLGKIVIFFKRHNHLLHVDGLGRGFEVSTISRPAFAFGFTHDMVKPRLFSVDRDRHGYGALRIGFFMFGMYLPRWLNKRLDDREYARFIAAEEQFDRDHPGMR